MEAILKIIVEQAKVSDTAATPKSADSSSPASLHTDTAEQEAKHGTAALEINKVGENFSVVILEIKRVFVSIYI